MCPNLWNHCQVALGRVFKSFEKIIKLEFYCETFLIVYQTKNKNWSMKSIALILTVFQLPTGRLYSMD